MNHPSIEELEAFVLGEAPGDPAGFRAHLAGCRACATRLAEEARLEEMIGAAVLAKAPERSSTVGRVGPRRPDSRSLVAIAAGLLAAFAGVWWIATQDRKSPRGSSGDLAVADSMRPDPGALPAGEAGFGLESESGMEVRFLDPGVPDSMRAMPGFNVLAPGDVCRWTEINSTGEPPRNRPS